MEKLASSFITLLLRNNRADGKWSADLLVSLLYFFFKLTFQFYIFIQLHVQIPDTKSCHRCLLAVAALTNMIKLTKRLKLKVIPVVHLYILKIWFHEHAMTLLWSKRDFRV